MALQPHTHSANADKSVGWVIQVCWSQHICHAHTDNSIDGVVVQSSYISATLFFFTFRSVQCTIDMLRCS